LDLHGATKDEVWDRVEKFLTHQKNDKPVRIITGKGKGIVKAEVQKYLKLARYHWSFEKTKNGSVNDGVLVVFLN